jgi:hypothetical protein
LNLKISVIGHNNNWICLKSPHRKKTVKSHIDKQNISMYIANLWLWEHNSLLYFLLAVGGTINELCVYVLSVCTLLWVCRKELDSPSKGICYPHMQSLLKCLLCCKLSLYIAASPEPQAPQNEIKMSLTQQISITSSHSLLSLKYHTPSKIWK